MPRKEKEKKNLIGEEDVAKSQVKSQEHSERKKITSHDDVL